MRKIAFTLIAIAAIAMVSCQKDESVNGPVFKALGESVTHSKDKTVFHTDNYTFTWKGPNPGKVVGDRIHIWDGVGHHKLYTPTSSDATVSEIVPVGSYNTLSSKSSNPPVQVHYTAIYPDYYSDTTAVNVPSATTPVTVNLPSIQGITNQNQADQLSLLHLTRFPMYCESDNLRLEFKNLCGALRLNLQRTSTSVDRIKFTSGATDPCVCGKFSINWNNGNPQLTPCGTNNEHTVVLEYARAVSINEATDFWLALPAGDYHNFVIEISCITSTGQRGTMSFKGNGTTALEIERSYVTPIVPNLDPDPDLGETGASFKGQGVFSVSNSKKVYFSPGNLQCVNNHWEFAPQQYKAAHDMISYGVNYVPEYDPDINFNWDLVGWSTDLSEYGTKHLHDGHSNTNVDNYSDRQYKNWGQVFGDDTWWVLSQNEFNYVINERVSNEKMQVTVNDNVRTNVRTDVSYRVIYVDGQEGCMLFPDVCSITLPSGVSFPDQYNPTHYTADQFVSVFERAGCIFLPYVGYQQNSDGQDFSLPVTLSGTYHTGYQAGRYWTSTPDPSSSNHMHAQAMDFNGTNISTLPSQPRTCLYSVRLVTNVPATK